MHPLVALATGIAVPLSRVQFWLEWGPETIAVLHCNNGIYRTGFILACFLVYVGQFRTIAEALAFFTGQREVSARARNSSYMRCMACTRHFRH